MDIIVFGLDLYFAAMLGVSGLAKIDNLKYFTLTLERQSILPNWSIMAVSIVFPWVEVLIALLLILATGIYAITLATTVVLLFVSFLLLKISLVLNNRSSDCGCYGSVYRANLDSLNIIISGILTILAVFHLWFIYLVASVGWHWRILVFVLFSSTLGWLLLRIYKKHQKHFINAALNSKSIKIFIRD